MPLKIVKGSSKETLLESQLIEEVRIMLLHKEIVLVRFMTRVEADELGWEHRPLVIQLDDGTVIYPAIDAEGNNGGVILTNSENLTTIPRL